MIQFNELRITPDGEKLIIDVSIIDTDYCSNVFIDSVVIDNQDTFISNGPSNNPVFTYTVGESVHSIYSLPDQNRCNPILCEDESPCLISDNGNVKNLRLNISRESLINSNLNNDLLFIYVITKGEPSPETPCELSSKVIGVVFNKLLLYNASMKYFRELEATCKIPKNFINYILRMKGLELSIRTGNYIQAIKYWNKFFKDMGKIYTCE